MGVLLFPPNFKTYYKEKRKLLHCFLNPPYIVCILRSLSLSTVGIQYVNVQCGNSYSRLVVAGVSLWQVVSEAHLALLALFVTLV